MLQRKRKAMQAEICPTLSTVLGVDMSVPEAGVRLQDAATNGRDRADTTSAASLVRAPLQYVKPAQAGEELFVYKYELPEGVDRPTNLEINEVEIDINDLRRSDQPFNIVQNGFQLERLKVPDDIDWDDDADVTFYM